MFPFRGISSWFERRWLRDLAHDQPRRAYRRRSSARRQWLEPSARRLWLQPLEDRTLLSITASLSSSGTVATFTGNAADNLYLSTVTDTAGASVLQYSTAANIPASSDLGAGQTLTIRAGDTIDVNLSGANSTLFIDSSLSSLLQSTGVTLNYAGRSSDDRLSLQVAADPTSAQTLTLGTTGSGSIQDQEAGGTTKLVSYTGLSLPVNLTVTAPAGPIEMQAGTAGAVDILSTSTSATFGTVTVPLNDNTIVGLNMAAGTNSVTVAGSVQTAILQGGGHIAIDEGSGSSNTLTSRAPQNAWNITGQNQGTLNSNISFTDVQNLVGSPGDTADDFTFSDQAFVSGMVEGGGGTDVTTLDYSAYTSNVAVNSATGTATLSLLSDVTDLWNTASGGTFALNATVNGGTPQTTAAPLNFNASAAQVQAALNQLTGVSVSVTGVGTAANPWVIVGTKNVTLSTTDSLTDGSSTVQVVPAAPVQSSFSGVSTLIGAAGIDSSGIQATTTLTGPTADSVWDVTGANAGSLALTNGVTVLTFSKVGNLTGAAANRDAFIIEQAGSISGTIKGVATANDGLIVQDANDDNYTVVNTQTGSNNQITVNGKTITYSGLNPFAQNGTTTIDGGEVDSQWSLAGDMGVESVAVTAGGSGYTSAPDVVFTGGGGSGAAGTAVVTNGVVTSVTITDPGSGYTSAPYVSFTGGGGTDALATAVVTPSGQMTITNLDGNFYDAGSQQYVTQLSFTTPTTPTTPLTVALGNGDSSITLDAIAGVPGGVNIQGGAGNNTLIGSQDASHTWNITGVDSGSVSGYGATTVTFSNVGTLTGGSQNDTFVYAQGASENGVDGGGGNVTLDATTTVYTATASKPNTANSIVFASSDGFARGEQVMYVSNLPASADTSGLTPETIYDVNVINATTIQLLTLGGSLVSLGASPWAAGTNLLEPLKTLDYSAASNVNVTLGTGNVNINNVIGGSGTDNTLVGVADDNVWTISGTNSGTVVTTRHDTTSLDATTVVNTATGTPTDPAVPADATPNSIVFPVSDGFIQGEQVTYVRALSTIQTATGGTQLWNNAGGGVFTITTVNGNAETTGILAWNADAYDVQAALNSLKGVNVMVTGSGTAASPWIIRQGSSGLTITTDDSMLTPTSAAGTKDASGLTPGTTYYVNVIDPYTIQLGLSAPSSSSTFTPVPLNGDPWANGNNALLHAPVLISSVSFSGFQNLAANGGNDHFILGNGVGVAGTIDGGTGISSLDYSAYTTPVTVNLGSSGAATTGIGGGILNIQNVIAPTSTTNTLLGPDQAAATWEITGRNSGMIDQVTYTAQGETLTGVTMAGSNTITGLDSTSGLVVGTTVTGPDLTGGPYTIASIASSTSITLNTGIGVEDDSNATLTLSVRVTVPVSFSGFANLTGAADTNDGFILRAGCSISGTISGGAGGDNSLAIENPADPGQLAIVEPDATGGGTLQANQVFPNTSQTTFAGLEQPLQATTSAAGVTFQGSVFDDNLTLSQNATTQELTLADPNSFWNYSDAEVVTGDSVTVPLPEAGQTIKVPGATFSAMNTNGANLVVNGDATFTGDVFTDGGNITVDDSVTVDANVKLTTRHTLDGGLSGTSIGNSGNITFVGTNINIDTGAQLLSYDDRDTTDTAGIPLGIDNQSAPAGNNLWLPGMVYRNLATTTNGSGTGLTVDVTTDTSGNATITMSSPGTGYNNGDTITIAEPNAFLTGSSSLHNGGNITVQVDGLQTVGGDITLSAYHHLQAIAWSYNPDDVSITVSPSAVIRGRNVNILANADNNDVFGLTNSTPVTLKGALNSPSDFGQFLQQKSAPLVNFLINIRILVGYSRSEASAAITLAAGSSIEASGGDVFAESFANSKANGLTIGPVFGFAYARSDASAILDVEGNVISDIGSVTLSAMTGNSISITTLTTNSDKLTKVSSKLTKLSQSASIAGAVTDATSIAQTTIGTGAQITAARDVNITAVNVKNMSTSAKDTAKTTSFGVSFVYAEDQATATATVDGQVTAKNGNVATLAESFSAKDSTKATFQAGQPTSSNKVNKYTKYIETTRTLNDAASGNGDAAAGVAALFGSLLKGSGDKDLNAKDLNAPTVPNPTNKGTFVGVMAAAIGTHTNTATATVGDTAVINAGGQVLVHANVIDLPVMQAQGLAAKFNDPAKPTAPGSLIVAISASLGDYTNRSTATVDSGAKINGGGKIDVAARTSIPYDFPWSNLDTTKGAPTEGDQIVGLILQALGNNNLGASDFFSTFTESSATGNKAGFALSATLMKLTDDAEANIDSGALINQATPITSITGAQNVSVTAITDVETANLVGNFPQILDSALGKSVQNQGANAAGIGGSFSGVEYDNTARAVIGSDALVSAYDLVVNAQNVTDNISLGVAGGKSSTTSVNGAANYVYVNDTTLAQIGQGAVISTAGTVTVTADDKPLIVNLAGGVSIGTSLGFGLTTGINDITRNTLALVGNHNVTLGGGTFTPDEGVNAARNTIDLGYTDGFANGDQVIYSDNGDDAIDGLSDGGVYYVWVVNPTTITLGRTAAEAEAAADAALGVLDTGPSIAFDHTALGSDDETIALGYDDNFVTGDAVQYNAGSDGSLFGLTSGTTYYVIRVDATHVRLANTALDAQNGNAITLTPSAAGSGSSLRLSLNAASNIGTRDSIGRMFSPAGSQKLSNTATGGTFTLTVTVNGAPETTAAIPYNADASVLQTALDNLKGVSSAQVVDAGPNAWIISGVVVTVTDTLTGGKSTLQLYRGAVTSTYDSINVGYVDGFTAGQAVYYSAGNDPVIPGLTNNTVYYVVPDVSNPDA